MCERERERERKKESCRIKHHSKSKSIRGCRQMLQTPSRQQKHILQWILSHVGLMGNETADLLAKKGSTMISQPSLPRGLHTTIHNIKLKMDQVFWRKLSEENTRDLLVYIRRQRGCCKIQNIQWTRLSCPSS